MEILHVCLTLEVEMMKIHHDVYFTTFLINYTHHLLGGESGKNEMSKQTCVVFVFLRVLETWF